jgi:hypothetical protein
MEHRDRRDMLAMLLYGHRLRGAPPEPIETLQVRIDHLAGLVVQLLIEVEALRRTHLDEAHERGVVPKDSAYGRAYRAVTELSHNSAGVTSGLDKVLGYTADELAQFAEHIEFLEQLT